MKPILPILIDIARKLVEFQLHVALLSPTNPIRVRYESAAADALQGAEMAGLDYDGRALDRQVVIVGFVWSGHESAWQPDPKGSNDQGSACGVDQVHMSLLPKGVFDRVDPTTGKIVTVTCSDARKDRVLSYFVAYKTIMWFVNQCGDLHGAMTAFSTGKGCPKPGTKVKVVEERCAEAGGC